MAESTPHIERSQQKFVFASDEPTFNSVGSFWFLVVAAIFVVTIYALSAAINPAAIARPQNAGVFVAFVFAGCVLFHFISRQWIAEIDLATRRLTISRRSFGRWTKMIVDCSLDQCAAFGTIEYNTDGEISYGAYVQLKDGRRHAIPLKDSTFEAATRVASQLSIATGVPRLDTRAPIATTVHGD